MFIPMALAIGMMASQCVAKACSEDDDNAPKDVGNEAQCEDEDKDGSGHNIVTNQMNLGDPNRGTLL